MSNRRERKRLRKIEEDNKPVTPLVSTESEEDPEEKFLALVQGLKIDFDFKNYPDSIFFLRDETIFASYNMANKRLWLSNSIYFLHNDIYLEQYDIELFFQCVVKKYFKLTVRPFASNFVKFEHFKK